MIPPKFRYIYYLLYGAEVFQELPDPIRSFRASEASGSGYIGIVDGEKQRLLLCAVKKELSEIPVKSLKTEDKELQGDGERCAICLEPYKVSETLKSLPCRHDFHEDCIDRWLLLQLTCPLCKMDFFKYYSSVLMSDSSCEEAGSSEGSSRTALLDELVPSLDEVVPSSDEEVPSSDELVPPSDELMPPSDELVPTPDELVPSSDELLLTPDELLPLSDGLVPTPDELVPSSDEVMPQSDELVPTPDEQMSSSDEQVSSSDELVPSSDERSSPRAQYLRKQCCTSSPSGSPRAGTSRQEGAGSSTSLE